MPERLSERRVVSHAFRFQLPILAIGGEAVARRAPKGRHTRAREGCCLEYRPYAFGRM